jgi:hypothetical protein
MIPICPQATADGQRFEVRTNRFAEESKWFVAAGKVKGSSEDARSIDQHLDFMKQRVCEYQKIILREAMPLPKKAFV